MEASGGDKRGLGERRARVGVVHLTGDQLGISSR